MSRNWRYNIKNKEEKNLTGDSIEKDFLLLNNRGET
jgi:hypothetical protein